MPKNYLKKRNGPHYNLQDVQKAVEGVINNSMTFREASRATSVPVTVIFNRINGRKTSLLHLGTGRGTELTLKVENLLEKCLIARAEMGYPCDRKELKDLVQKYVTDNGMSTRFKNNLPGDYGFMNRHPRLSLKMPEHLQKARKTARDPYVVYGFFDSIEEQYAQSFGIGEIPRALIFNADESGFKSDPSKVRGIGVKNVSLNRVSDGSGRESTSVLACVSADDYALPPLVVFSGKAV